MIDCVLLIQFTHKVTSWSCVWRSGQQMTQMSRQPQIQFWNVVFVHAPSFPQSSNLARACDPIENQYLGNCLLEKKTCNPQWDHNIVMWYWSVDTLFWQLSIDDNMDDNINDVPMAVVLLFYFSRYGAWQMYRQSHDNQNFLDCWFTKLFKVWGSAHVPLALRSSTINWTVATENKFLAKKCYSKKNVSIEVI